MREPPDMGRIPTGTCRHCKRPLHFMVEAADWCDNLGWYLCPAPNISKHYPVDPIEGIDY